MITQAESGLSSDLYNAIQDLAIGSTFDITAHRWNLEFEEYDAETTAANNKQTFSSVIVVDNLYKVFTYAGTIQLAAERINLLTGVKTPMGGFIDTTNTMCPPSVVADGSAAVLFYKAKADSKNTIYRRQYSEDFSTNNDDIVAEVDDTIFYLHDSCEGGTVFSSAEKLPTPNSVDDGRAVNAFDNFSNTYWKNANTGTTGHIGYQFPELTQVYAYSVRPVESGNSTPKNWTFEGSLNGTDWATLDTQTNVTTWTAYEDKYYVIASPGSFYYYRLNITAVQAGGLYIRVGEIQMFASDQYQTDNIILIAAANKDRLHYIQTNIPVTNGPCSGYGLRTAVYEDSAWTGGDTVQFTFPWRPLSMDVITRDGVDYLFVAVNTPGKKVERLEGTTLKTEILEAWALLCFEYKNGQWGVPIWIDRLDEVTAANYAQNVKAQWVNDTIWVTLYSSFGAPEMPITGYRYYTSKDGINWSAGNLIYLGSTQGSSGFRLHQHGDYVYAVEQKYIYRSHSTLLTGYSAPAVQERITHRVGYSISQDGILQANLELSNNDGWLDNHAILNRDNVVALQHQIGYYHNAEPVLMDHAYTEVDVFEHTEELPEDVWRITARDRLGWMADKSSEYFRDFQAFTPSVDYYADIEKTNYGGLSHWWTQSGEWYASDNELYAADINTVVMGFSTLITDIWNGVVEVKFNTKADGMDDAAILFRAYDKLNYMAAWYNKFEDKIIIWEHRNGLFLKRWGESAALGLSIGNWYTMQVRFYMDDVTVYLSTDGITFTEILTCTVTPPTQRSDVRDQLGFNEDTPLAAGYVGLGAINFVSPVYFKEFRVYTYDYIRNLEDVFKVMGSFVGIHDYKFENLLYPATATWAETNALINLVGYSATVTGTAGAAAWGEVTPNIDLGSSQTLEFTATGRNWGIRFRQNQDDDWSFKVQADGTVIVTSETNGTLQSLPDVVMGASDTVNVRAIYHEEYEAPNIANVYISVWFDQRLVTTYVHQTTPIIEALRTGLLVFEDEIVTFTNIRYLNLGEVAEICTIDPNETPISALQRSIDGKFLKYFMRFDGSLKAWRPIPGSSEKTISTFYGKNVSYENHEIKTVVRMVGAQTTAEYYDTALLAKYGHRFTELNNPYLLSVLDCYLEAIRMIRRIRENALSASYNFPYIPYIEIEDHVTMGTDERIINSMSIEAKPGYLEQSIQTREFISG